jgi:hypothetical protein
LHSFWFVHARAHKSDLFPPLSAFFFYSCMPPNPYSNSFHYKQNWFRLPTIHRSFAQFEANQCLYPLIFFIFCTWSLPLPLIAAFILVFSVSQQRQEIISAIDKSILISPLLSERRKYVIT